jgi:hypothetical protein
MGRVARNREWMKRWRFGHKSSACANFIQSFWLILSLLFSDFILCFILFAFVLVVVLMVRKRSKSLSQTKDSFVEIDSFSLIGSYYTAEIHTDQSPTELERVTLFLFTFVFWFTFLPFFLPSFFSLAFFFSCVFFFALFIHWLLLGVVWQLASSAKLPVSGSKPRSSSLLSPRGDDKNRDRKKSKHDVEPVLLGTFTLNVCLRDAVTHSEEI